MIIYLIGFMGCGKSTVGKTLSTQLAIPFVDLDAHLEEQTRLSISEIFAQHGEAYFRAAEKNYLLQLSETHPDMVLSLGGGTPCFGNAMYYMLNKGITIYLKAETQTLYNRLVQEREKRPLVAAKSEVELNSFIEEMLTKRTPYYQQATYTLNVEGKTPNALSEQIAHLVQANA